MITKRKQLQNRLYYCRKRFKEISNEYALLGGWGRLNYYITIKGLEIEIYELEKILNEVKKRTT